MNLKKSVRSLLSSIGLYVHFAPPDALHNHLHKLFDLLGINVVLDVGGHYGEYGLFLREHGYRGRIASFEPTSEALARLKLCAQNDFDWRVFDCALGREPGELDINIASQTVFNSFLSPTLFSMEQFNGSSAVVRKERVRIDTLARMFSDCIEGVVNPRVYLKLDTQGFDLEVLHGAGNAIEQVLAMQSEVSVQPIYDGMPNMNAAVDSFQQHGFKLTGLYPVTRDAELGVIEFDCVMRRIGNSRQCN